MKFVKYLVRSRDGCNVYVKSDLAKKPGDCFCLRGTAMFLRHFMRKPGTWDVLKVTVSDEKISKKSSSIFFKTRKEDSWSRSFLHWGTTKTANTYFVRNYKPIRDFVKGSKEGKQMYITIERLA